MLTHLFKVHFNFNHISHRIFGVLILGTLFFSQALKAKEFKIALLDTAFCPHLIKTAPNIQILPVLDFTQSTHYECRKEELNSRKYHGHWVLNQIVSSLKVDQKIVISPMIIFNKQGHQLSQYWKLAFDSIKDNSFNLIVAAAGLPVINDKKKLAKIDLPKIPIFLAAGRVSSGIKKDTILFPHDFYPKEKMIIFGSFYPGLQEGLPHFSDNSLINASSIDFYLPFNFRPRQFAELKGTSLAVALGTRQFLRHCLGSVDFLACLKDQAKPVKLSQGNLPITNASTFDLTEK